MDLSNLNEINDSEYIIDDDEHVPSDDETHNIGVPDFDEIQSLKSSRLVS